MRKTFLLIILFLAFIRPSFSSHSYGGEIGWRCLGDGSYQFYMSFFRDCSGIPWLYQDETIEIKGAPLPKDPAGNNITSILLRPDSSRWNQERQGDLSPYCASDYGSPISCKDGDLGAIQEFFYLSDSIVMKGVPPTSGWKFYWHPPCCRSTQFENMLSSANNTLLLRAEMFPTTNKDSVDFCLDSSPEFVSDPITNACRSTELIHGIVAQDIDFDSVTYAFAPVLNLPVSAPTNAPYKLGYSFDSPTPDTSFDTLNVPASVDETTGIMNFAVYSGVGISVYHTVISATAWRDQTAIAKVYREIPYTVFDCPLLPGGNKNYSPVISLDSDTTFKVRIDVQAGDSVIIPIKLEDEDTLLSRKQQIKLTAIGTHLSTTLGNDSICLNDSIWPCAIFRNSDPVLDTNVIPSEYAIIDSGKISTELVWKTNCSNLNEDGSYKDYQFYIQVVDDHCPLPGFTETVLTIRVLPDTSCGLIVQTKEESLATIEARIFPNPSSEEITISLSQIHQKLNVQLRNIHGQLIQENQFFNQQHFLYRIEGKAGIYFLQLTDEKGKRANFKIIKQD